MQDEIASDEKSNQALHVGPYEGEPVIRTAAHGPGSGIAVLAA